MLLYLEKRKLNNILKKLTDTVIRGKIRKDNTYGLKKNYSKKQISRITKIFQHIIYIRQAKIPDNLIDRTLFGHKSKQKKKIL